MKKKSLIHETIADIAYLAGQHGYYSGDSRADMQEFISLARKFEKQYSSIDWNAQTNEPGGHLDYMTEVENFAKVKLKLKPKLILNYPVAFEGEWDNLEIERCREDGENTCQIHDEDDVEPNDFWSVYAHQVEGGSMCIADVPTEKDAIELHDTIARAVKSYKNNGYLSMYDNKALQAEFNNRIDKLIEAEDPKKIVRTRLEFFKREINALFI